MTQKNEYNYEELLASGRGELFGPNKAKLPLPNMLMFDRITRIAPDEGAAGHGLVVAELDIKPDLWFFGCHFQGDPVMPGCLGLDSLWQLTGFFLTWSGHPGSGRALGVGEVKFFGQILPTNKRVTYRVDIKRVIARKLVLAVADGSVAVDGKEVYTATGMKVGLFESTEGF
jgi:3-hydroxyacyl-[acyl-carrier protein] dehydratase/trans-2-decenoyl-[acyl-carrier protein] isomerase